MVPGSSRNVPERTPQNGQVETPSYYDNLVLICTVKIEHDNVCFPSILSLCTRWRGVDLQCNVRRCSLPPCPLASMQPVLARQEGGPCSWKTIVNTAHLFLSGTRAPDDVFQGILRNKLSCSGLCLIWHSCAECAWPVRVECL
eukprot:1138766-Pelagomonas_calceolata.AAC.3